jgi:hypothetical protein
LNIFQLFYWDRDDVNFILETRCKPFLLGQYNSRLLLGSVLKMLFRGTFGHIKSKKLINHLLTGLSVQGSRGVAVYWPLGHPLGFLSRLGLARRWWQVLDTGTTRPVKDSRRGPASGELRARGRGWQHRVKVLR